MAAPLDNLGNGAGLLYVTDSTGLYTGILRNIANTPAGAKEILTEALIAAPLSGEILATATLNITAVSGTGSVTGITINGTQILSGTVTGTTPALLNTNLAANIVAYAITSGYTAYVSNGLLYFQAATGTGSTPNGYVVVVSSSNVTSTNTNMSGGSTSSGVYSTGFNGKRFFIWADAVNAVQGSLSGATEISSALIQRGNQTGNIVAGPTAISSNTSGQLSVARNSSFQIVSADTASSASSGTLASITTAGFVDGDMLQIRGTNAARVLTVTSGSGAGLILLSNGVNFVSGNDAASITVEYVGALGQWVEVGRSPGLDFTTSSVRGQGIPWAVPGSTVTTLTAGGETISLTPGVSTGIQYLTGTPTLTGSWSVVGAGSPMDGDTFFVSYRAVPVVGVNTVTIFGATLTTTQAQSGKIFVRATYVTANTAYDVDVFQDFTGQDWATVASVNAKENSLGNPAVSGYVLSSTTGGTRSWVPNGGGTASGITIANRVYVNKSGNDSTGLVQRFDLPFLTIAAARAAANAYWTGGTAPSATNRILIDVATGYYTEGIILDNYIDYALSDCIIERQSGNFGTIDDGGVSCNSIISGNAILRRTGTGTPAVAIQCTNSGSSLSISCNSIYSSIGYTIGVTNGTISVNGQINTTTGGITVTAGTVGFNGSITVTGTLHGLLNTGGTVTLNGNINQSGTGVGAELTGGTTLINGNIVSSGSGAQAIYCYTGGTHTVNGNVTHTGSSAVQCVVIANSATLNINGNVIDSVSASAAIFTNNSGTLNMNGNVTASTASAAGILDQTSLGGATFNFQSGTITADTHAVSVTGGVSTHKYTNTRLVVTGSNKTTVNIGGSAVLIIKSCTMIATGSGNSISGSANNVLIYGACEANLATATITQLVGTVTISVNVV